MTKRKGWDSVKRAFVWGRDRGRCRWCYELVKLAQFTERKYEPDDARLAHGQSLNMDGADDWHNVYCACHKCNSEHGSRSIPPWPIPPDRVEVINLGIIADSIEKLRSTVETLRVPTNSLGFNFPPPKDIPFEFYCKDFNCPHYSGNPMWNRVEGGFESDYNPITSFMAEKVTE